MCAGECFYSASSHPSSSSNWGTILVLPFLPSISFSTHLPFRFKSMQAPTSLSLPFPDTQTKATVLLQVSSTCAPLPHGLLFSSLLGLPPASICSHVIPPKGMALNPSAHSKSPS